MWEDRKKQELKEAAIAAKTPSKDCDRGLFSNSHPMLSSWIQSRKLRSSRSYSFNLSKKFSLHLYVVPVILWCLCTVDSLRGTGEQRSPLPSAPVFSCLPTYLPILFF